MLWCCDVEYPSSPDTCTQGINHMEIEHYEAGLAPLGPTDVRVAIKAVGICGSDVHYLKVRLGLRVNIEYCGSLSSFPPLHPPCATLCLFIDQSGHHPPS